MSFDQMWQQADPDAVGGGGSEPPAIGVYNVALADADAFLARSDGKPWMKFTWRDLATEYEWDVLMGFGSSGAVNFAKAAARDIGVDVDAIAGFEALKEALKAQAGGFFEVEVVQNGEYRNTYIRGAANRDAGFAAPPDAPAQPTPADDDIPF